MNAKTQQKPQVAGFSISIRSFLTGLLMLLALMVLTYILTFFIPGGAYERREVDGQLQVVPGTFSYVEGNLTFLKWLFSPILVLGAAGGGTVIAIIVFLLVIGGIFHCMEKSGLMYYMLQVIGHRFAGQKYRLLAAVTLFFMCMGSFVGSFEESVPLVPIVVALAISLGWDGLVGLGMSLLAIGCGFSTGICNPFTVGIAQQLAGLPMFSGAALRALCFLVVYAILLWFLIGYAKKIEADPSRSLLYAGRKKGPARKNAPHQESAQEAAAGEVSHQESAQDAGAGEAIQQEAAPFQRDPAREKGLKRFALILGVGIVLIFLSGLIPFLQSVLMPLIALLFLTAGLAAVTACRMSGADIARYFKDGAVSLLPAILLILMASSVRYTLTEAQILDTILYGASGFIEQMPAQAAVLLLYGLVLLMNFFIASGSAKAFLMMPLIVPIADFCQVSRQLGVLAFAFGDGFSNVFYFTNPVLLISLGLAGVSYGTWARWSLKFQAVILAATGLILLAAACF